MKKWVVAYEPFEVEITEGPFMRVVTGPNQGPISQDDIMLYTADTKRDAYLKGIAHLRNELAKLKQQAREVRANIAKMTDAAFLELYRGPR